MLKYNFNNIIKSKKIIRLIFKKILIIFLIQTQKKSKMDFFRCEMDKVFNLFGYTEQNENFIKSFINILWVI